MLCPTDRRFFPGSGSIEDNFLVFWILRKPGIEFAEWFGTFKVNPAIFLVVFIGADQNSLPWFYFQMSFFRRYPYYFRHDVPPISNSVICNPLLKYWPHTDRIWVLRFFFLWSINVKSREITSLQNHQYPTRLHLVFFFIPWPLSLFRLWVHRWIIHLHRLKNDESRHQT